jgi:hypothetical protein
VGCAKKTEYSGSGKGHVGTSLSGHTLGTTDGVGGSTVVVVVVVDVVRQIGVHVQVLKWHPALYA